MLTTYRLFNTSSRVLATYSSSSCLTPAKLYDALRLEVRLSLHDENIRTPDHLHKERVNFAFHDNHSLARMLLLSLGAEKINDRSLEHPLHIHDDILYIRQCFLEEWQCEVTAHQNTIPFIAAAWEARGFGRLENINITTNNLLKTLKYSALPCICDNRLHDLIQNDDGSKGKLHDLHIHFNGSTEFAHVWLYALNNRYKTAFSLIKAYTQDGSQGKVPLFYKQRNTSPKQTITLLHRSLLVRSYICKILSACDPIVPSPKHIPVSEIIHILCHNIDDEYCSPKHPFQHHSIPTSTTELQREGVMWLHILRNLRETENHYLAMLVHVYLLLSNQYLQLLVQQKDQFGFDQFQYITLMGARDPLENENTHQRFLQFHGMYGPDLEHIEARFAPKDDYKKIINLLKKIWAGYQHIHGSKKSGITPCVHCPKITSQYCISKGKLLQKRASAPKNNPTSLGLVAHFIKKAETGVLSYRHQKLRRSLYKEASALVQARKYLEIVEPDLYMALVGKDAASNELETPPEVFAPIFRFLYREGIARTTYHAGEDFEHVLSGIRAVHEAITFLQLGSGDRIGHATALGINPKCSATPHIHCAQGHWLDNLVWLTWLIAEEPNLLQYSKYIPIFEKRIQELYQSIFEKSCPELPVLWRAWKMRDIDVLLLNEDPSPSYVHTRLERKRIKKAKKDQIAFEQFLLYHNKKTRKNWNKSVRIDDINISTKLLRAIQDTIISEMREKNIIVEVLPTSNVRISHYDKTEEHHVLRWLDEDDKRPVPQVVLGTDDPGIFSTTIRNEYALLLHNLQKKYASNAKRPYQIIQHLIDNGRSYKFKNMS